MSSRYQSLVQERADLTAEARALFDLAEREGRALSDDEQDRDDAIAARLDDLNEEIGRLERQRDRERALAERAGEPAPPSAVARISGVHDRTLGKPWGYDTYRGDDGHRKIVAAFGEQLQAIHRARMVGNIDPRLIQAAATGAGISSPEDGGFLVGESVSDNIMLRAAGGEVLSRVRRNTLGAGIQAVKINLLDETSRATGSRFGGVQAYWVDEGSAPTATRPKFYQQRWEPHKLFALGYATDELLADASLLGSTMFDAFSEEVRFLTENAILRGTGVGMPFGIFGSKALISVDKETGQAAKTVLYENIVGMCARLYAPARPGAVWLINQDIEPSLYLMNMVVGTGGMPVYLPPGGAADAPYGRLYGLPLIPNEYSSTLGTLGDIALVNLNEYFLVDKGAPERATSMHVAFTTDEQAFRLTWRVDGHPLWRTTLTPFQGSNTQSPYITLAARA
jgi:HK97 family phage major capsid protein